MVKLTKSYQGSINLRNGEDEYTTLKLYILRRFSNWRDTIINKRVISEGHLNYRIVTFQIETDQTVDTIDSWIKKMIEDYKLIGVQVIITQQKIILKNTLIGDRITYYTIQVKDDKYSIKTVVKDLEINETMKYGCNMFRTKEEAEQIALKIMNML